MSTEVLPPRPHSSSSYIAKRSSPVISTSSIASSSSVSPKTSSSSVFSKRLSRNRSKRNGLDFGCAGERVSGYLDTLREEADEPVQDFSSYRWSDGSIESDSSSRGGATPSLTHSRATSTASDISSSYLYSPIIRSPLPAAQSRVPLTPKTFEKQRKSQEIAAVDALNEYFDRVRLSRVDEEAAAQRLSQPASLDDYPTGPITPGDADAPFELRYELDAQDSTYEPPSASSSPRPSRTNSGETSSASMPATPPSRPHEHASPDVATALEHLSTYFSGAPAQGAWLEPHQHLNITKKTSPRPKHTLASTASRQAASNKPLYDWI